MSISDEIEALKYSYHNANGKETLVGLTYKDFRQPKSDFNEMWNEHRLNVIQEVAILCFGFLNIAKLPYQVNKFRVNVSIILL